jgi:hypothetical protein
VEEKNAALLHPVPPIVVAGEIKISKRKNIFKE